MKNNQKRISVEKIGGTSMSEFDKVIDNIILNSSFDIRIFVMSAYGDVTNELLEHKKSNKPGIYSTLKNGGNYEKELNLLLHTLFTINKKFVSLGLDIKIANEKITQRIEKIKTHLKSIVTVMLSGYVLSEKLLLAGREILASIGEYHSTFNSFNILQNRDIPCVFMDLSGLDDTNSLNDKLTIDDRIQKKIYEIKNSKHWKTGMNILATGYAKGVEGIMREFDRGYSEVTFSKIATCVKANEAIIHKEFHLCSADPKIVGTSNARIVGLTNFDVADQLADIGMEAIHPKASKPLEQNNINLRIKNTFDPKHSGTLITKDYIGESSQIEIITGSNEVCILEIHDPCMVGEVGFDFKILEILKNYNISYIMKTTNANSILHLLWESQTNQKLIDELHQNYELVKTKPTAVICLIGSNIAKPGVLAEATKILSENNINVLCVSQTLRQVNMQFLIERNQFHDAIKKLNHYFCQKI